MAHEMTTLTRNPWVAIMQAAHLGKGLHLSADEVRALSFDGAIEACAVNDIDRVIGDGKMPQWKDADPKRFPINPTIKI